MNQTTTPTPDLSDPWYAGQILPRAIPGLGWLVKPEQQPRPQTYPPPAIMHPDSLARIEAEYQEWLANRSANRGTH